MVGGRFVGFGPRDPLGGSLLGFGAALCDRGARRDELPAAAALGTAPQRDRTYVNFDLRQMGLGCINSWGELPEDQYMIPYGDYTFRFLLRPTVK